MSKLSPTMNRRDLIRSLGAGAALALAGRGIVGAAEGGNVKGRIKQCVTRGTFSKMPIEEFCKTIKGLGLVGVDLVKDPKEWAVIRDHGLDPVV